MHRGLKYILLGFISLLFFAAEAQYSKIHFLPPTYNQNSGIQFSTITVTTLEEEPFDVVITNASGSYQNVLTGLSKDNPITITLPKGDADGIFMSNEGKTNQALDSEGFIIVGNKHFFTSQIHSVSAQGAVIAPKGSAGLGTEFYSGHLISQYSGGHEGMRSHFISVIASEDNTTITFDNPNVKWQGQSANEFSVTLNKGESYVVAAPFSYIKGLTANDKYNAFNGTHVTSDKPIAMNSGSFLGGNTSGGQSDAGVDQIVPVTQLNDEFILVQGQSTNTDLETALVVATEDNTQVFVNGSSTPAYTLNKGEYAIVKGNNYVNKTMHLKTSNPAMVYQNLAGSNSFATVGMVFVPGLMEDASRSVLISDANSVGAVSIYIVAKKGESVTINGKEITSAPIENSGNSNWVSYRLSPSDLNAKYCVSGGTCANKGVNSDFLIESTGPINAAVSVVSGAVGAAGYFSGFASVNVDVGVSEFGTLDFTLPCTRDTVSLIAKGADAYSWDSPTGDDHLITKVNDSTYLFDYDQSGDEGPFEFRVMMEATSVLGAKRYDTATITVNVEFSPECIPTVDTFYICEGQSVVIEKENIAIGEWSGNEPFTQLSEGSIEATPTQTTTYYISSFTKVQNALTNGDFEEPNRSGFGIISDATVPGWSTTASDRKMEFWVDGFASTPAYSGNQFVELNANMPAALYQDMATTPGSKLMWGFAHRGRGGEESMHFEIGPPGGPYERIQTVTTGKEWIYYNGVYEVPAGQTTTRFYYSSAMPGSFGNLMDAVEFFTLSEEIDSVIVVVHPNPEVNLGNDTAICLGESLVLDAGDANSYSWSNNENSPTIEVTTGGTYDVTVTNEFDCEAYSSVQVDVEVCFTNHIAVDTLYICEGDSVEIEASEVTTQVWGGTDAFTEISNTTIIAHPKEDAYYFIGEQEGYTVGNNIIVNGNFESGSAGFTSGYIDGCSDANLKEGKYCINSNPKATHSGFATFGDHTSGGGNMMVVNAATAAGVKVWCQNINVEPGLDYEFSGWITSVYYKNPAILEFQINGELMGSQLSATSTVGEWLKYAATWNSELSENAEICLVNKNTAGGGNDFAIDDISFAPIQPISSGGDSVLVIVYDKPEVNLGNDTTICFGNEITFETTISGDYQWNDNSNKSSITVSEAGDYSLKITSEHDCVNSDTIKLQIKDLPIVNLGNDTTICIGDEITIDAKNPGLNYKWNNETTVQTLKINAAGIYGVEVTDELGCLGSDSMELFTQALPVVDLGEDQKICDGKSVMLDANNEGLSFAWSNGENSQTIEVNESGTYSVEVTDEIGCLGTDEMELIVNPMPVVDLGNDTTICIGESVTLDAQNTGFNYKWNTGESSQTINITSTGSYTVEVYDEIGCADTSTMYLDVHELPIVDLGEDQTICDGKSVMLDAKNEGLNFAWNTGETSQTIEVNESGTYSVEVTDEIGCLGTDDIELIVNPMPFVNLGNDTAICIGESVILDAQNNGFNYKWNTGESSQTINITSTGNYTVEVYDEIGCADTSTMYLDVHELPIVQLGNDTVICEFQSIILDAQNENFDFIWTTGSIEQTIEVSEEGLYGVEVRDEIGCLGTDEIYITKQIIEDPYSEKEKIVCEGTSIILEPDFYGDYFINWEKDLKNATLEVSETGEYASYVATEYCVDTFIINVEKIDTPDAVILDMNGQDFYCFDVESTVLKVTTEDNRVTFEWDDFGRGEEFEITEPRTYALTANNEHCSARFEKTIEEYCKGQFFIPNAFTPGNDDGLNEYFMPVSNGHIDGFDFRVYNRWGVLIYQTNNQNAAGWDGTFNGNPVQIDVYTYRLSYDYISEYGGLERKVQIGTVTLLR